MHAHRIKRSKKNSEQKRKYRERIILTRLQRSDTDINGYKKEVENVLGFPVSEAAVCNYKCVKLLKDSHDLDLLCVVPTRKLIVPPST